MTQLCLTTYNFPSTIRIAKFNSVTLHFAYGMILPYLPHLNTHCFSVQHSQIFFVIEAHCVLCEVALESSYIVVLKGLISVKNEDGIILAREHGGKKTLGKPTLR